MRRSGILFLTLALGVSVLAVRAQAQSVRTRHVREAVSSGEVQPVGRLASGQIMNLNLVLPLSDAEGLKSFLSDVYDPSSSLFHKFLTPTEFTAKFGPSQAQYDAVVQFAVSNGFTVTGGSRDAMDVQVRGPVSAVESAFHVHMATYQHPAENREFYAPDNEPTTDLPFELWHISGLDNYSIPHRLLESRSDYAAAHGMDVKDVVSHATTGSGPSASFLGSDMRAAYYGTGSLTGAGQNLGLFEFEGSDLADLGTYFKNVAQTNNVPIT